MMGLMGDLGFLRGKWRGRGWGLVLYWSRGGWVFSCICLGVVVSFLVLSLDWSGVFLYSAGVGDWRFIAIGFGCGGGKMVV